MGIHDETRFPNAFVRFRRQVGFPGMALWVAFATFFLIVCGAELAVVGFSSRFVASIAGSILGVLLRPAMLAKPWFTSIAIRALWLVIALYILLVHNQVGKPTWSWWLISGSWGFYLSATFVFYSSKFLYIAKLLETLPPQHANDGPPHDEDDQQQADGLIDQEVEEARRREAQR
jgi:hypothetical protein